MMDLAETMTSPSSSSTSRNTPWVLGCCGPMLTVIVSVRSSGICPAGSAATLQPFLYQLANHMQDCAVHFLHAGGGCVGDIQMDVRQASRFTAVPSRQGDRRQALRARDLERFEHVRRSAAR